MVNKKKKKQGPNLIKVSIATLIIVLVLGYSCWAIITLIKHPTDTFMVEEGKLSLEESSVGYIIRDETIIQGKNYKNGIVKIKSEGEKVAKGEAILRYHSNNEAELTQKIADLDSQIEEALQNETSVFSSDITALEGQIKVKLSEAYKANDIQTITKIKNDVNNLITKKAKIAGDLSPSGSYIKKLVTERTQYEKELNDNSEYVVAPKSGVITYTTDGYEEMLASSNLDSINKDLLDSINIKTGQVISNNDQTAKIINNFEAYIATIMSSNNAMNAAVGDKVTLQLSTKEEVNATIEKIISVNRNERILIFKITKGVESLINYRKISVDVIWWSSSGLKVPNSSILTEGNYKYVVRNRAGYTDKIMIKVLKQNDAYSIIDNYSTNELKELGYSTSEIRNFKMISLYDEIVLNPTP